MRYADAVVALESLAPGESKLLDSGVPICRRGDGLYMVDLDGFALRVEQAAESLIITEKRLAKARGDDRSANEE